MAPTLAASIPLHFLPSTRLLPYSSGRKYQEEIFGREGAVRPNSVKQKWRKGEAAIGGWLSIPSSYSAELMAHQGFDWLCVDTQHGVIDYTSAVPMLQAISTT